MLITSLLLSSACTSAVSVCRATTPAFTVTLSFTCPSSSVTSSRRRVFAEIETPRRVSVRNPGDCTDDVISARRET